ncbi:MAG TPA: M56 family metallopeptidase [Steroidobacteraceae bacterium]
MNIILIAALKGTVVLAVAWAAALLLRRSSADLRHRVWLAAMIAIALLLIPWPVPEPLRISASAALGTARAASAASPSFPWWFMLWATGAVLVLLRMVAGMIRLAALTRAADRSDQEGIRVSASVQTPMTWGVLRPVILLPAYTQGWPEAQRDIVIRHERAHIERRDWMWMTFSQAMTAIFWFHPLMWLASARLRNEAELAADDATLAGGIDAPDYADRLVEVARQLRHNAPQAAVAMVRKPMLAQRVSAILDAGRDRHGAGVGARLAILLAAAVLLLPLSAFQTRKVYHVKEDGTTAPKVASRVQPQYTKEAKEAKIQGTVELTAVIDQAGRAQEITITKALDPGLDANAMVAVHEWTFEPGTKDGKPVDVAVSIEVNFRLR